MSLHYTLTCEEEEAIKELDKRVKHNLTPCLREDKSLYYRFLKAREFDVDKAEIMLKKHIIWRKVHQMDTILQDFTPNEAFFKYMEVSFVGFDKDGDLIGYSPVGNYNPSEVINCMTSSYFMKNWYWFAERYLTLLEKENEKTGKNAFRATLILDLEKLTFANAASKISADMFLKFIAEYQDNFPERMKTVLLINVPTFYKVIFSILKTIMSSGLLRKIHIFGKSGWKEKLLEMIDADDLPAFLGGNRTDPDGNPLCTTFIKHGGRIPERYFLSHEQRYFEDLSRVKQLNISPKGKKVIPIELTEIGSLLQWKFYVNAKDIGFGIIAEIGEVKKIEIIPVKKFDTPDGCEKGSYKCRCPGIYVVVFDNSYSWLSSKEVQYCIDIVKPDL